MTTLFTLTPITANNRTRYELFVVTLAGRTVFLDSDYSLSRLMTRHPECPQATFTLS